MKRGLSIMDPTADDLAKYELSHEIAPDERPLWLGAPDMKYAFSLASPTILLFIAIIAAFWRIKLGFDSGGSARDARAMIVFDCTVAFFLIADLVIVLSLKQVLYLITDRCINIFIKDIWYVNLNYNTRKACQNHRGRVLKYDLSKILDIEARKSYFNGNIGNIYLENSILSDGAVYRYDAKRYSNVSIKFRWFPIQLSTRLNLANIIYAINDVSAVCDLLRCAINRVVRRSE